MDSKLILEIKKRGYKLLVLAQPLHQLPLIVRPQFQLGSKESVNKKTNRKLF